jgi:hypothetical protein
MAMTALRSGLTMVVVAVVMLVARPRIAEASIYPCYVAFIHGAGYNDVGASDINVTETGPRGTAAAYWWPSGKSGDWSFAVRASRQQWPTVQQCAGRIIRYESTSSTFYDAASTVAAELNDFIASYGIGANQLIIIGHSMGGLVARFIVNTGSAGNMYYPGWGGDYTSIVDHTKYLITVQTPHTGTKGGDALHDQSNDDFANAVAAMLVAFGFEEANLQNYYMAASVLEPASAPGGWMGDGARTKTIFSIAGDSAGSDSREANCASSPSDDDCKLEVAWLALYQSTSGGDGLVERASGHGFNGSTSDWTQGFWTWLDGAVNHNQGRYDMHQTWLWDFIDASGHNSTFYSFGGQIMYYGLDLPGSAQRHDGT